MLSFDCDEEAEDLALSLDRFVRSKNEGVLGSTETGDSSREDVDGDVTGVKFGISESSAERKEEDEEDEIPFGLLFTGRSGAVYARIFVEDMSSMADEICERSMVPGANLTCPSR